MRKRSSKRFKLKMVMLDGYRSKAKPPMTIKAGFRYKEEKMTNDDFMALLIIRK